MKRQILKVAILMVLAATTAVQVKAGVRNEEGTVAGANKVQSSKLIAKEGINNFVGFMSENAHKFTKKAEWNDVLTVLNSYNQNSPSLMKLSDEQKNKFNEGVAKLQEKLAKVKGEEASAWNEKLSFTAKTINFLWNFTPSTNVTEESVERIEVSTEISSL
ncbi:hypothetical protein SAMN04515674_102526 [Pseudarcicella hirudinis]|uniref:Group-specific protein n=1 Tax=Pseudarcicella hirudinis TaxID=1079859 RepID=A0A1I5PMD6_9BACT|nr:hypothetical protein [Pseudarcicella hirudinis]SFP34696.1 hypothetical protein SAMN04515674_102526 [Pseudarcicella hirudinis]